MNRELEIKRGDIYWVRLGEGVGSIQGGVRPCVVVSNNLNNKYSPTLTVVPVSTQIHKAKLPTHVTISAGANGLKEESFIMAEQITITNKSSLCGRIGQLSGDDIIKLNKALEIQINLQKIELVHTEEETIADDKMNYIKGLESFLIRWVLKGRELIEAQDEIKELRSCINEYNRFCKLNRLNRHYEEDLNKIINVGYRRAV